MGLKGWTVGELEKLLEFKEGTQAFHFKRRNSRLGEFRLCVLILLLCKDEFRFMLELQKPENPCSVCVFWTFSETAWRRMNYR